MRRTKRGGKKMPFGRRLKLAMTLSGFSVPRLATKLGVSQQIVRKWLASPTPNLSASHLVNASKLLSVRAHWLATGEGPQLRYHASEYTREEFLMTFESLSKRDRVFLRDVMGLILKFSQED